MAETIGSLVDKITIIELKIYHMQEQVKRLDASQEHRHSCQQRLSVLRRQRMDLLAELADFFKAIKQGRAKIKIYRQFKMYNDPRYRSGK